MMPCCGRTPLEVPRYHRMTLDLTLVTCALVHGDCGMDVVDPGWYHGVAGPPMAYPGDGCER